MGVYRTTFPIAAPARVVWDILSDFARWPEWNPSVPRISGTCEIGSTASMTLAMPGRPSANVKATLTHVIPEHRLRWRGNVGTDRLFSGVRDFEIHAQPDGTVLLTHEEKVTGLLFPVFRAAMGRAIQRHHDGLNAALKQRAEQWATV